MIRPTARGWSVMVLAAILLAVGLWWRYPGLVALGAGFAALTALALLSVATPMRVRAGRSLSVFLVPRLGRCVATVEIVHLGRWLPSVVEVAELVDGEPVTVLPAAVLRPGEPVTGEMIVPTSRRGAITLGPLRLRRSASAGLAERVDRAAGVAVVRVLPRVLPVTALPQGAARWIAGSDERIEHGGTDLVGLRDYLAGDDLRRLHWATSARVGRLMVREDADPSHGRITVLLDDLAASHGDAESFEEAVDVAASIAAASSAAGQRVRLRSASGRVWAEPAEVDEILALLGDADLVEAEPAPRPETHDVLVVVGGVNSNVDTLAMGAGQAAQAMALIVAPGPGQRDGLVPVVRGDRAEELLRGWEERVSL